MRVFVEGIGLHGPGLPGWPDSAAILAGAAPYVGREFVAPKIDLLPAAERRRTSPTVKLALAIAQDALRHAGRGADDMATVFVSSGGDGETIHAILTTLLTSPLEVSPTKFHNSVHNAPSGYWAVAAGSRAPSTTLCAHDWSFAAGLIEASAMVAVERRPVALIAHDIAYPEPLHGVRPILSGFGVAVVLGPEPISRSPVALDLELTPERLEPTVMKDPGLERLRAENPAARALPLLALLARKEAGFVDLETAAGGTLRIGTRDTAAGS